MTPPSGLEQFMAQNEVDVLIVGAGLSGIGAAVHLQKRCPGLSYTILEGRGAIGGTWDIHRYPGIRSDSDMYTLGYNFKPWTAQKAIADGPSILAYVRETAAEHGIKPHIRFNHMVESCDWDSRTARWTVRARHNGQLVAIIAKWVLMAAGYYQYAKPYTPDWPGMTDFKGQIVHPMFWDESLDYAGKRVVIIGSGATAVTIAPVMAKTAAHVTLLQRSPTYMVSMPSEDSLANFARKILPPTWAYGLTRWRKVLLQQLMFHFARTQPEKTKQRVLDLLRKEVPEETVQKHMTPRYNVWDQRVCLVPDSDFFQAMGKGALTIQTDEIESFTATGMMLKSGAAIAADIVVTATGFNLENVGGAKLHVDGRPVELANAFAYKGVMYSGAPNLANFMGYTNASWTLKSDLTAEYICRLMNHMRAQGVDSATPTPADGRMQPAAWIDFTSGYVQRSIAKMPKQGERPPWRLYQNYVRDMMELRYGKLDDPELVMAKAEIAARAPVRAEPVAA
jgi:cation diffusion facilitator CzcD-associated flavoprotein CzcO